MGGSDRKTGEVCAPIVDRLADVVADDSEFTRIWGHLRLRVVRFADGQHLVKLEAGRSRARRLGPPSRPADGAVARHKSPAGLYDAGASSAVTFLGSYWLSQSVQCSNVTMMRPGDSRGSRHSRLMPSDTVLRVQEKLRRAVGGPPLAGTPPGTGHILLDGGPNRVIGTVRRRWIHGTDRPPLRPGDVRCRRSAPQAWRPGGGGGLRAGGRRAPRGPSRATSCVTIWLKVLVCRSSLLDLISRARMARGGGDPRRTGRG